MNGRTSSFSFAPSRKKVPHAKNIKGKGANQRTTHAELPQYVDELVRELAEIKDFHQSLIDQYETSQNELTSANQELQSANEEFLSANEEIETAKEELQSTNEELVTVNDELQIRNTDLTTLSNDLNNLLSSIEIPVLIVGGDLRIRCFSPHVRDVFSVIPSDTGRPLAEMKSNFVLNFGALVSIVAERHEPAEVELQDHRGKDERSDHHVYPRRCD